jgi:hypothetical protein
MVLNWHVCHFEVDETLTGQRDVIRYTGQGLGDVSSKPILCAYIILVLIKTESVTEHVT